MLSLEGQPEAQSTFGTFAKLQGLAKQTIKEEVSGQIIASPWLWYTSEDWDAFRDPRKTWASKVCRAVERLQLCGCTHPDEHTLQRILALLLSVHYAELPGARDLYNKLQDLKKALVVERKPCPFTKVKEFPKTPSELPKDVFDFAYSTALPVTMELPGVHVIGSRIPLRSTSKLLKDELSTKSKTAIKKEFESMRRACAGDGSSEELICVARIQHYCAH